MTRRPDDFPDPVKPVAEMTSEEKQKYARDLRRWLRDGEVRRGRKKPRSMRETEIFLEGAERRREASTRRPPEHRAVQRPRQPGPGTSPDSKGTP